MQEWAPGRPQQHRARPWFGLFANKVKLNASIESFCKYNVNNSALFWLSFRASAQISYLSPLGACANQISLIALRLMIFFCRRNFSDLYAFAIGNQNNITWMSCSWIHDAVQISKLYIVGRSKLLIITYYYVWLILFLNDHYALLNGHYFDAIS